ncbi:MAG: hypothetical protein EBR59_05680 [Methylococcaceae bacterium]|nr:hypothetical protein [Methylococcaceae bacterium]
MNKKIIITSLISIGICTVQFSHAAESAPRGLYLGAFGGGSTSFNNNISQSGEAYKRTGGLQGIYRDSGEDFNLLVNVKGKSEERSAGIGGAHLGYEFPELPIGGASAVWGVRPAIEIEGYYLGSSISGTLTNPNPETFNGLNDELVSLNGTTQLNPGQHKFVDTFSQNMGVLLTNGVFSFKTPWASNIFPYIGGGIGAAINSLSGANSAQVASGSPYAGNEKGLNHFNSNNNANSSAFAAQAKAGVRAELFDKFSVFAEYRYLHVTDSNYTFGSTEYPATSSSYPGGHAQTSAWNVGLGSMDYHTGILGLQYDF